MSGAKSSATQEIKARLNIVDIIRRYVDLRRAGNRWVAPCPFHQETKPSFSVNEEEGFFYCFGCQAAGDLFDFYSRINGLEFRETLEQLALEAGVLLHDTHPTPKMAAGQSFRKTALRMYELASAHFRQNLSSSLGAACRAYLKQRTISPAITDEFELGWSLPEWRNLADALRRAGFTPEQGVEAGLLAASDSGGGYDRFRGRLIFPIKNLSGQVIAFGGRIIGDGDTAKYINSADSPLYKKGDNLYGLFQARRGIATQKSAILTEGYMDVLTLHQFGYTNACGVLGTALTPEQVRRLAGFCSNLELIFDGDAPGRKAALKACEMVLTKGLACKVVIVPENEDIDSLLQKKGSHVFEELRRYSPDGLDFCLRTLSAMAPREALAWVKKFLTAVEQPELLSRYISKFTRVLDLDEKEIRQRVHLSETSPAPRARPGVAAHKLAPTVRKDALDRWIMKFVVRHPHTLPVLHNAGAPLLFTQQWALSLWEKLASCAPDFDPDTILRNLDDKEKKLWGEFRFMEAPPKEYQEKELADICATIGRRCAENQANACMQALARVDKGEIDYDLLRSVEASLRKKL